MAASNAGGLTVDEHALDFGDKYQFTGSCVM